MGAILEGYELIVVLDGVKYEIIMYVENVGYRFETVTTID
jgi:hypothetical protein